MKNTNVILLVTALLLATTANASYTVLYGGKQIDKDNIRFINKSTPPTEGGGGTKPPEDNRECSDRSMSAQQASWTAGSPSYGVLAISWGGVQISVDGDYLATEKIIDGYKYTPGPDLIGGNGSSSTYTICRVKI